MNKARLRELADHIEGLEWGTEDIDKSYLDDESVEGPPDLFNMSYWLYDTPDCQTCGCIAGHAAYLFSEPDRGHHAIRQRAEEALELTIEEADDLFEPLLFCDYGRIAPAEAAAVLRRVADGWRIRRAWENAVATVRIYVDYPTNKE